MFTGLPTRQLRGLVKTASERTFPEGATVVKQGEKGIGLYLIVDGLVEVRRGNRRLASLGPGQFFGETALFDDQPRSADVIAKAPTRCLILSRWEFWGFASGQPDLLRGMMAEMVRRLAETNRALSE